MHVGVIGINHKLANLKLREAFAQICRERFCLRKTTHLNLHLVVLSTCNRSEVYFSSKDLPVSHSYILNLFRRDLRDEEYEFDQILYSYFGQDCFNHLVRVTVGLDSAIVAETEIQGQVRAAYESASTSQCLPIELHFLFQKALKIGKQIRSELPLGRGIPSLEHAVFNAAVQTFGDMQERRVLFVGASEINYKILAFLKKKGLENIALCNRTDPQSPKQQVQQIPWSELRRWSDYDCIIFGTKAPEPLLNAERIPKDLNGKKLILDLSVPRNVDPEMGKHPLIALWNIDQINHVLKDRKEKLHGLLLKAESRVLESTIRQVGLFRKREEKRPLSEKTG